ncbi:hypothetical protein [Halosimplex pelagicum]|uniref:Uncharacterized protein n=1 Tax=Halosimplex pelagicum TaxID=869886 RepID=A0A7D5T3J1_9EURY|nr:hypothetical protein [Halosimplex pelagicum]QLH80768.1 hypothetical protein HZS54_03565 [Halosimplex pelagicum]
MSGDTGQTDTRQISPETQSTPDARSGQSRSEREPQRCTGESVTAEAELSEASSSGGGLEYHPSNDTVTYVVSRNGTEGSETRSDPFAEWAERRSARVGRSRVETATNSRLGTGAVSSAVGGPPDSKAGDAPIVWVQTSDEEGDPTIDEVVRTAPGSVTVSLTLGERDFSRTVPVFARVVDPQLT